MAITISGSGITSANIADGTIVSGDIASGAIASSNIADGTIVNADINSSAAIVGTKLSVHSVRVTKTTSQTISNGVATTLTWDSEKFDDSNMHSNTTNNSRLTAPVTGKYLVGATAIWAEVGNTNGRFIGIMKNGSTWYAGNEHQVPATGSQFHDGISTATMVDMTAGDYVEARVEHRRGSSLDVKGTTNPVSNFWMHFVSN
jgi:hypothetical protein